VLYEEIINCNGTIVFEALSEVDVRV
jgi:hypothetical protein